MHTHKASIPHSKAFTLNNKNSITKSFHLLTTREWHRKHSKLNVEKDYVCVRASVHLWVRQKERNRKKE
uniref:Uncharacterized protein n=1 Tax=Rhizophora mucronata TaxID=61149 RepID=A0A2P2NY01_RHIMU